MKTRNGKASTATRKYFHALVVIVYTSGIFIDVNFLYLSSIVGICLMGLLEHMRLKNIEPVSSVLKNAYKVSSTYNLETEVKFFSIENWSNLYKKDLLMLLDYEPNL